MKPPLQFPLHPAGVYSYDACDGCLCIIVYCYCYYVIMLSSCCHCFCHLYSCFQCTHFLQEGPHCGFSCIHLGLQSNSEFFSSSIITTTEIVNLGWHSVEKPIGNWTRWPSENGFTVNLFKILFGKHFLHPWFSNTVLFNIYHLPLGWSFPCISWKPQTHRQASA